MPDALRAGVILSALFALVALSALLLKTLSFGRRPFYSRPSGSALSGVIYAMGPGMMPWEKESARLHLPTYTAGVLYHAGIFAGLLFLFCDVFSLTLARGLLLVLRAVLVVGAACGLSLLGKRLFSAKLRKLSCPDDYAANAIVTLFVILAAIRAWQVAGLRASFTAPTHSTTAAPGPATVGPLFYAASILMFLYVPAGKIRHCFFFFYSRILLGIFFGRRGALQSRRSLRQEADETRGGWRKLGN